MSSKFSFNEEVTANGYKAKVISIRGNAFDGYSYRVKFLNTSLIPKEMDFSEEILIKQNPPVPKEDINCPACGTPWKIVKFNMQTWKDCTKCNKTYEQIMKEYKNNKYSNNKYSNNKYSNNNTKESDLDLDGLFNGPLWDDDGFFD